MGKKFKLDELGSVGRGRSRHRPRNDSSLYGGKYPFFQTGDIKNALLYLREYSQTYNETGLSQSKLWAPGTLCITIAANIAETAILGIHGCFPDSIVGFIPNPNLADARFIKYYIDWIKISMQSISKGTTQDNLSIDKLLSIEFDVPDVLIQQRIANVLSSFDILIENNRRRIQLLEEMARALYREWFVHFRFPGHKDVEMVDSELGKIPKEWSVVTMGDLYRTKSGGTPSRKVDAYFSGEIHWVKTSEVIDGFILETHENITKLGLEKSSANLFNDRTVLIAMYGYGTLGRLGILSKPMATNQACCAIIPKDAIYSYPFTFLTLYLHREKIINLRFGAAQQNINQEMIRKLEIANPSKEILLQFNKASIPIFESILVIMKQNKKLSEIRDSILPRLVSGKIDVSDLKIDLPPDTHKTSKYSDQPTLEQWLDGDDEHDPS